MFGNLRLVLWNVYFQRYDFSAYSLRTAKDYLKICDSFKLKLQI